LSGAPAVSPLPSSGTFANFRPSDTHSQAQAQAQAQLPLLLSLFCRYVFVQDAKWRLYDDQARMAGGGSSPGVEHRPESYASPASSLSGSGFGTPGVHSPPVTASSSRQSL
jgi:hypothetical protein